MHSFQSVARILLQSVALAVNPGSENGLLKESSDSFNLLILPLSVYFAQYLLCQCNYSQLFYSVVFNIPSIVSVFAVSLNDLIFVASQMIPSMNTVLCCADLTYCKLYTD